MSAKQHKRLRKVAVGFAAMMEQAGRRIDKVGYDVIEHRPHGSQMSTSPQDAFVDKLLGYSSAEPRPEPPQVEMRKQLVLRKDSLKAIVKTLKKRHA